MKSIYKVNPKLGIPIYRQLVDIIQTAIKKGELSFGEKLPTVQEMMSGLGIARGTVKRAYDELERAGLIEKAQGKGTFVCYEPMDSGNRKERAMASIDAMFRQLEQMGFTPAEINIFLNLRLRDWSEQESSVKIAVIECNPETLSNMAEQLRHISGVDLYSFTLESVKQYPYKLSENFDLVVTTLAHEAYLESVLADSKKLVRVALRPSVRFLSQILRLCAGGRLGIVSYSSRFARLVYETCRSYLEDITLLEPFETASKADPADYLQNADAIVVPKLYEKYFNGRMIDLIREFQGEVIECYYELDEGSLLHLERKIKRLLDEKTV